MVYLCIKEIRPSPDEVIIITSSLIKDMNSKNDLYRANSIRVLCQIIDPGLLSQIERFVKQAVVDKAAVVAASALVSGIHILGTSADIVKRWNNEVQEATQSRHSMVQFHAVSLQHALRVNDRLAVSKLVSGLTRGSIKAPLSPMAQCLLIRYVSQVRAWPHSLGNRLGGGPNECWECFFFFFSHPRTCSFVVANREHTSGGGGGWLEMMLQWSGGCSSSSCFAVCEIMLC